MEDANDYTLLLKGEEEKRKKRCRKKERIHLSSYWRKEKKTKDYTYLVCHCGQRQKGGGGREKKKGRNEFTALALRAECAAVRQEKRKALGKPTTRNSSALSAGEGRGEDKVARDDPASPILASEENRGNLAYIYSNSYGKIWGGRGGGGEEKAETTLLKLARFRSTTT